MKKILLLLCFGLIFSTCSNLFAQITAPIPLQGNPWDEIGNIPNEMMESRRMRQEVEMQQRRMAYEERLQAYREEILRLEIEKMKEERYRRHHRRD